MRALAGMLTQLSPKKTEFIKVAKQMRNQRILNIPHVSLQGRSTIGLIGGLGIVVRRRRTWR